MTLTDYAKYLLNVCGKRFTHLYQRHYLDSTPALPSLSALLTYLRTQTATIYAHLQSRLQGDPTSGIPSVPLTTPLTLANLLPNLQKLATRKIDAGASTQIPEGISLARYICQDSAAASTITKLVDTNSGWTMNKQFPTIYTSLSELVLGCETLNSTGLMYAITGIPIEKLTFPTLKHSICGTSWPNIAYCTALQEIYADELIDASSTDHQNAFVQHCDNLNKFSAMKFERLTGNYSHALISMCPELQEVYLTAPILNNSSGNNHGTFGDCPKLIHLEVGCLKMCDVSLNVKFWNPTTALDDTISTLVDTETETFTSNLQKFLYNFQTYIVNRLSTSVTNKTLTLSSAVFTAITNAGIAAPTGWTFVNAGN